MAHFGMRGSGDWSGNIRPESFREGLLRFYPNGNMPLTAITAMSKKSARPVKDPKHNWATRNLPARGGALTAADEVYTEPTLTSKYTSGGAVGDVVYAKCASAVATQFIPGTTAMLSEKGEYRSNVRGRVVDRSDNGANSYVAIKLIDTPDASYDLDTVNYVQRIGNSNPEGGDRPDAWALNPTEYWNYTQIFRNAYGITGTQKETELRYLDALTEAKQDALEAHGLDVEQAIIFGERSSTIGENGKPERTLRGIIPWLISESSANGNVEGFSHGSAYSSSDWLGTSVAPTGTIVDGGMWLGDMLEVIFRYGSMEKIGVVGSGAMLGLHRLAEVSGDYQLITRQMHYGLKFQELVTPFGSVFLKTHPLFNQTPVNRYDMLIVDPNKISVRPLGSRDTKPMEADHEEGRDGIEGEWLGELTLELHEPPAHGYLTRVGLNHDQVI